ncbi:cell division protein FtsI [Clostridium tagluense]|uniref:peptidoglycan D,D-transpeptidase FtsI family protein n=1 Tax=Clostridium tagluense TaxID=360422 RepID=UPI001CF2F767|nr:penicillin-binding transpeptidase domain-containing protein [Clostridium tagluense]MCB2312124.1 cell division protein FtsI [Clostridium tagluense]MCB2316691.1 cell division protein FtsI [Clostridium tagluense]MCB2321569.1 cell division protein FtsI [Clostridium tagluense]MCB2326560.1 cell division protein FtsI [Clostridium tagluense]MCB2331283.1 cell division protein FtsI [Clostridium tagluense]
MKKKKKFSRYNVLSIIMLVIFATIVSKLYYLQVYKGQYYKDQAQTINSAKLVTVAAPRGLITDKNGIKLATEALGYNLTYTSTTDTSKDNTRLFATLQKVFKILDDNKEVQTDSFPLKINPYRFEFTSSDAKGKQVMLLRFLKDRGFQDKILKVKFKGKKEEELSTSEVTILNNELLKLTPEQIYNQLLVKYSITTGIASLNIKASPDVIRRYLIVEDSIKMNFFSAYKSINIATNIKQNTSLIFEQILSQLQGFKVENQPMRVYPYGQLASSVLGYISKISSADKAKYSAKGYDTSVDYVGTSGIEAAMESSLKGENGEKDINDDSVAIIKNTANTKTAIPGKNVQLTLDANMQYATENALNTQMKTLQNKGHVVDLNTSNATRGAAVAIDINTGGILALVSLPGYNPNDFSRSQGLTEAQSQKYFNPDYEKMVNADGLSKTLTDYMFPIDKSIKGNTTLRKDKFDYYPKYLYNYATMSLIPSGSTFKPMTAIAGLETGVIDDNSTYLDQGGYDMGGENKVGGPNWNPFITDGSLGLVNVVSAIRRSSNPFFMNVGQKLREKFGDDILAKYAWMFGLGANPNSTNPGTGIEINENFGQVYNTVSQKTLSASQYLLSIEQDLTNGVSSATQVKFPPIDLYDRDEDTSIVSDGKKLSEIKAQIKDYIRDSVKNGTFSKKNYVGLFKQLIAADPMYKNQKFTATNINEVVTDVYYQAVQTGHGSLSLPYNMFIASIGQGMDNFTPLQMANYIATLANGGTRYKVHLVDNIKDSNGKLISQTKPVVIDKANLSAKTISLVMQGMNNVTGAGGNTDGTASEALGDFPIPTGGKTGTAQFTKPEVQSKIGRGDYAWYVGYAPADNPKIAISVVIFDGGYGSDAANVARGMYESYFKNDPRMKQYKDHYDIKLKRIN